jgi:hypothetical protein
MVAVRRLLTVLALAVFAAVVAASPASAQTTKCSAYAVLKPGNEVRPSDTTDPVDSRASGATAVHITGTQLTVATAIFNPFRESFFAGHIHVGAAGVNGGIVVTLFSGSNDRRLLAHYNTVTITETTAANICGNLAGYYVNYHTTADPQGAVRGQLVGI